ncbi:hypothetical protein TNCV_3649861 [Trichonephila clavipes]|nr:hypothetical protein TNCV_3649861 [Trichonephila clavipes]
MIEDKRSQILTNVWRSIARFGSCAIKSHIHSLTRTSTVFQQEDFENMHPPLSLRSVVALRLELMTRRPQVRDPNHKATATLGGRGSRVA